MTDLDTSRISPTAHYTGYVWCRNGLSPPQLATVTGRAMFYALQGPMLMGSTLVGRVTLEKMLLVRHLLIDHVLDRAIEQGRICQVLEIAAGLSGRGHRLTRRHPNLTYIEGDLPGMVARKRRMLARIGTRTDRHQVVALNALAEDGPESIYAVARDKLDADGGIAIVTEGLLPYFPLEHVHAMWSRFSQLAASHQRVLYVSDLHLADRFHRTPISLGFRRLLRVVAGGRTYLHFADVAALEEAMATAGFDDVSVHIRADHGEVMPAKVAAVGDQVKVVEAWAQS